MSLNFCSSQRLRRGLGMDVRLWSYEEPKGLKGLDSIILDLFCLN